MNLKCGDDLLSHIKKENSNVSGINQNNINNETINLNFYYFYSKLNTFFNIQCSFIIYQYQTLPFQMISHIFSNNIQKQQKENESVENRENRENSITLTYPFYTDQTLLYILTMIVEKTFCVETNERKLAEEFNNISSPFQSMRIPNMTILQLFKILYEYCKITPEVILVSVTMLLRIFSSDQYIDFPINTLSIHRLLLVTCAINNKFWNDEYVTNKYISKCFGISSKEMNEMELYFLQLIQFNLFVSRDEYNQCVYSLIFETHKFIS